MGDDIFIKKIRDVFRLSEKYHSPKFSKFLDSAEQAQLKKDGIFGGTLFGGYEDAERCMLGVFPDWQEPDNTVFPISVLKISKKYDKELSHRDYLGTVLSLGIERNKIGDILADADGAYMFVAEDIADFISGSVKKVAGCGVIVTICKREDVKIPERRFVLIETVAGSLRLDAVLAAMLKISRSDAKVQIISGRVSVNHIEVTSGDYILKENDLLSVRGFGRAELLKLGGRTRSDRIHVTLKKYI